MVNNAAQTVIIDMSQVLYDLTFIVTEDNGVVSNGTRVVLNNGEQSGVTSNGQVKFSVSKSSTIGSHPKSITMIKWEWYSLTNFQERSMWLCKEKK